MLPPGDPRVKRRGASNLSNMTTIPLDTKLADSLRVAIETTFRDSFQIDAQVSGWHLENGNYVVSGHAQGSAVIKLPPFADLEIPLSRLWRQQK